MPKSRSLRDFLEDTVQFENTGSSGPDKFQAAPSQATPKESVIGGAVKSAAADKAETGFKKGTAKGRKGDPKISKLDEFQFGIGGIRDELF